MTDLVELLQNFAEEREGSYLMLKAAVEIKCLRAALQQVDNLIEHQYTGSRPAMTALQLACDAAHDALESTK